MILKSFELNRINLKTNKIILFYGKNEGYKNQEIKNLSKSYSTILNYDQNEIIENSSEILDSFFTRSLFEKEKFVIINRATDKIYELIDHISSKNTGENIFIINADHLEKKSKLRKYFEKSNIYLCIPFYPDTNEALSKIAFQILKNKNISISSSNLNLIVSKCKGDRKVLFTELEKIIAYANDGKNINTEVILKLTNLIENHSVLDLVDNCLAKNKKKTISILIENNFSNEDCILITRIFLNKLKKILNLCEEFEKNKNIELTISTARPPIFWKEKEVTKQQIINWTPRKIKETLYKINDIELSIKKNYENSVNLITNFILNLSSNQSNN